MSTFAIGDIHGNRAALDDLLAQIGPQLGAADTVVFLGDYIDRGLDTRGCLDAILRFRERTAAAVVALLGNHEYSLLKTQRDFTCHSWLLTMEAWPTIASYSPAAAAALRTEAQRAGASLYTDHTPMPYHLFFEVLPEAHLSFLLNLRLYHRTADVLCVHAGIEPRDGPIENQHEKMLVWGSHRFIHEYRGPEIIVYGHWGNAVIDDQNWPRPILDPYAIGVDTIKHGVLTAVQMPERRVFQSARYRVDDRPQ